MASHLPPELVYKIVNELRVSDPLTVQSASLICKNFQIPSQQLLYERFRLTLKDGGQNEKRLEGLATSSRLVSYILDFLLSFPLHYHALNSGGRWISAHGDLLNSVLEMLSVDRIQRFELLNWFDLCQPAPQDSTERKNIKDRLRVTVEKITGGASLQTLSAKYMVISALHRCGPALKRLELEGTIPAQVHDLGLSQDSPSLCPKARLNRLGVHSTMGGNYGIGLHQYLLHPNGPFDLGALAHLSWVGNMLDDLAGIMKLSKTGLTSLELGLGSFEKVENSRKHGLFRHLKHLVVHSEPQVYSGTYNGFEWLYRELSDDGHPHPYALTKVCFTVNLTSARGYLQLQQHDFGRAYRLLDATLANQHLFPELREVEVYISATRFTVYSAAGGRGVADTIQRIDGEPFAAMPCLKSRDLLKVKIDLGGIDGAVPERGWHYEL
ncbi:hypothetical protein BKA70DRAFT_1499390 [Coprinopsis sp. MPI-PUGE-AT-0042]|nr:hypothetical protein BKA70DRAFT_1499390 [Coprinopsis sp. MPI-PUGE-AT-0042]